MRVQYTLHTDYISDDLARTLKEARKGIQGVVLETTKILTRKLPWYFRVYPYIAAYAVYDSVERVEDGVWHVSYEFPAVQEEITKLIADLVKVHLQKSNARIEV